MRLVYLSLLYFSVLMTVHPWEAKRSPLSTKDTEVESKETVCYPDIKVRRNTAYEIHAGQDLVINCTVVFCSSPPPAVSWLKVEPIYVLINISNHSHIKTDWKLFKEIEGISYLIFQKIQSNDSGLYQCQTTNDASHVINVTVHGDIEPTTVKPQLTTVESDMWPYAYRATATMGFIAIVIAMCVTSKLQRTGVCCERQSRNEADLSLQPPHHGLRAVHIYENETSQNRLA